MAECREKYIGLKQVKRGKLVLDWSGGWQPRPVLYAWPDSSDWSGLRPEGREFYPRMMDDTYKKWGKHDSRLGKLLLSRGRASWKKRRGKNREKKTIAGERPRRLLCASSKSMQSVDKRGRNGTVLQVFLPILLVPAGFSEGVSVCSHLPVLSWLQKRVAINSATQQIAPAWALENRGRDIISQDPVFHSKIPFFFLL